jgi:hypothetical protein
MSSTFSSSVIALSNSPARWSADKLVAIHGWSGFCAAAGVAPTAPAASAAAAAHRTFASW